MVSYPIHYIILLTICGCWTAAFAGPATEWTDLHCKFSALDLLRIDSFFQLPRTLSSAKEKNWVQPGETYAEAHLTTLCRKSDATVCLLFDDQGSLAGYQIAIPRVVDALRMPGMDYVKWGLTEAILFGEQWYIARVFFEPIDVISRGGRPRDDKTATGLWLPLMPGVYLQIPRNEKELQSKMPLFKKQNCYNKMGQHYYYNLTRSATPKDISPFFLLYSKTEELIGWGFIAFGSKAVSKPIREYVPFLKKREWFEYVPTSKIREVAPDTPDWVLDYKDKYGFYNHHVYMSPKPWNIACDNA